MERGTDINLIRWMNGQIDALCNVQNPPKPGRACDKHKVCVCVCVCVYSFTDEIKWFRKKHYKGGHLEKRDTQTSFRLMRSGEVNREIRILGWKTNKQYH